MKRLLPLVLVCCLFTHCSRSGLQKVAGRSMGMKWSLQAERLPRETKEILQKHLDDREAIFSHWQKDSLLNQWNKNRTLDWQPLPLVMVEAVKLAKRVADETSGALDITLAPWIDAAGFGSPEQKGTLSPSAVSGWQYLDSRLDPPALRKKVPDLKLNLACVVEGCVLEELRVLLKKQGLHDYLLELGGEVVAEGHAPGGEPWSVGIQRPDEDEGVISQTVPLSGLCVSTSGSYRQRRSDGKTHLFDPHTKQPIQHRLVSVSVFHASAALADAYATALMVLGPEEGRKKADELGLRVVWIEDQK